MQLLGDMIMFSLKSIVIVVAVAGTLGFSYHAQGQASRTWVSGVGDDVNPCSRTAPCKTWAGAISKTAAGGEINAIDSGAYGAVTLTKSITLDGAGVYVGTLATLGSSGIIVNAAGTDIVTLRNININGMGTGADGIRFLAGGTLNVQNVNIFNFAQSGIEVAHSTFSQLNLKNVSIFDCATNGIQVNTSGGSVFVNMEDVQVGSCPVGVEGIDGARFSMRNCNLSQNTTGLIVRQGVLASRAHLDDCLISNTTLGIRCGPGVSIVKLNGCSISNNSTAFEALSGGTFQSAGNNAITGNTVDGAALGSFVLR